ncbi:MAG: hypothetical protein FWC10_00930 [Lentimicrobiaceae bacterium]|nr:hypothetical protein [Lentimicrobiaceae bacterium]
MNENEKNLFYSVLKDKNTEEPKAELAIDIMQMIHKKVQKKAATQKIWEVAGYILLVTLAIGFVGGYLIYYTNFKFPSLNIHFEMPSRMYMIIVSVIFVFALIELYCRKKLYERQ